jgi:formylglycine-generating enzyme required for sulfatase activity
VTTDHACCAPDRSETPAAAPIGDQKPLPHPQPVPPLAPALHAQRHEIEQADLPGGEFAMGDAHGDGSPGDGEWPVHPVRLAPFSIDATSVTNADFARFVDDTGFRTDAEDFGFSAVFHLALRARPYEVMGPALRRHGATPGGTTRPTAMRGGNTGNGAPTGTPPTTTPRPRPAQASRTPPGQNAEAAG